MAASPQFEKLLRILHERALAAGLEPLEEQRSAMDAAAFSAGEDIEVEEGSVAGVPLERVTAPGADPTRLLLYLHGGGYVMGSPHTHRKLAADLSRAAGVRVLLPDYPLAPEHPFPAALDAVTALCSELVVGGVPADRLAIGGDSAGGGLAIAALLAMRDRGRALPAAAVVISPWVDLVRDNGSDVSLVERDPIVTPGGLRAMRAWYLGGADAHLPLVSPVLGDLTGLPPLLIHVGASEILLDDARKLADRAADHGVDVTLEEWPDMIHVWHVFAGRVPEATEAVRSVGVFLASRLA